MWRVAVEAVEWAPRLLPVAGWYTLEAILDAGRMLGTAEKMSRGLLGRLVAGKLLVEASLCGGR